MNKTFTCLLYAYSKKLRTSNLKNSFLLLFFIFFFICSINTSLSGQCTGTGDIITTGPSALGNPTDLDPNGDGYITKTGNDFASGTVELSEFEELVSGNSCLCEVHWTRFGGNTSEPDGDTSTSGTCGNTDLVSDGLDIDENGDGNIDYDHAYYTIFDQDGDCSTTGDLMIAFRMRVAMAATGAFSFEVLVNTDLLLGNDDPHGIQCCNGAINSGFEREIQLQTGGGGNGVNVYNIDGQIGQNNGPTANYALANYSHVANACGTDLDCGSAPVLYTFFLPLNELGYPNCSSVLSDLSLVAITSPSTNPVIDKCSSISDVGGINDNANNSGCGNFSCPAGCSECVLGEALICAANIFFVLPVDLTHFSVTAKEEGNILKWRTASEDSNYGYEIEKSPDARSWEVVGFQLGQGTTEEEHSYTYIDRRPVPGYNYYRLKQLDLNGQFKYSDIEAVLIEGPQKQTLQVFPNPNGGLFTLGLHNPENKKAAVKLFDSTGNLIWEQEFRGNDIVPYWEKKFDLPQREIYFAVIQVGDQIEMEKISVIGMY